MGTVTQCISNHVFCGSKLPRYIIHAGSAYLGMLLCYRAGIQVRLLLHASGHVTTENLGMHH